MGGGRVPRGNPGTQRGLVNRGALTRVGLGPAPTASDMAGLGVVRARLPRNYTNGGRDGAPLRESPAVPSGSSEEKLSPGTWRGGGGGHARSAAG